MPDATPLTTPPLLTVAATVLLLLHSPPVVPSVRVVVDPPHTMAVPLMLPTNGIALINTSWVAATVPQLFVTA